MRKAKRTAKDEMRAEYKRSAFSKGLTRGKYAERLRKSSNVVVLKPEVTEAFPSQEAVNNALLSLIQIAGQPVNVTKRSTSRTKKRHTG